jgi:hypothetical protein
MTYLHLKICSEVARAFKIPHAEVKQRALDYFDSLEESIDTDNHPVLEIILDDIGTLKFIATKNIVPLFDFFNFERVKKSALYSDMLDGFTNHNIDFVVLMLHEEMFVIVEEYKYANVKGLSFGDAENKYVLGKLKNILTEIYT